MYESDGWVRENHDSFNPGMLSQLDERIRLALSVKSIDTAFKIWRQEIHLATHGAPDGRSVGIVLASGELLTAADLLALKPRQAVAKASEAGLIRLPAVQIFILVLCWLILVVGPVAAQRLPSEIQGMMATETGTIGLGIAITQTIIQKRK